MMCTTRIRSRRLLVSGLLALVAIVVSGPAIAETSEHFHQSLDCRSCHELGAQGRRDLTGTCVSCHAPGQAKPWGSTAFHAVSGEPRSCSTCHSFHEPERLTLPGSEEPQDLARMKSVDGGVDAVQCRPCHQDGGASLALLTPGHRAAAAWYHANFATVMNQTTSESCLRCHDGQQDLPEELEDGWDPPRPHVAASHPNLVPVSGGHGGGFGLRRSIDPRLELIDGKIECTTCHDLFVHENDMLVQFDSRKQLCLGCHQRNYAPGAGDDVAVAR